MRDGLKLEAGYGMKLFGGTLRQAGCGTLLKLMAGCGIEIANRDYLLNSAVSLK